MIATLIVRLIVAKQVGSARGVTSEALPALVLCDVGAEDARFEGILFSAFM